MEGAGTFSPSASSHALPAPNPVPNQTGHALRLNSRTEKMTPNEKPRPDRITPLDNARSHCVYPVSFHFLQTCRVLCCAGSDSVIASPRQFVAVEFALKEVQGVHHTFSLSSASLGGLLVFGTTVGGSDTFFWDILEVRVSVSWAEKA